MGNRQYLAGPQEGSEVSRCLEALWLAPPGLESEEAPLPSGVVWVWHSLLEECYCNPVANMPEHRRPEEEAFGSVSGSIVGLDSTALLDSIAVRGLELMYSLGCSGYRPVRLSGWFRFGLLERPRGSLSRQSVSLCRP